MSEVVDKLTEDCQPRSKPDPKPTCNPAIDKLFRSYGGLPERVDNWQAIALSCLELLVFAITPKGSEDE